MSISSSNRKHIHFLFILTGLLFIIMTIWKYYLTSKRDLLLQHTPWMEHFFLMENQVKACLVTSTNCVSRDDICNFTALSSTIPS